MFLKEQKIKFMGIFKFGCNDGSIVKGAAYRSISVPPIPVKGAGAPGDISATTLEGAPGHPGTRGHTVHIITHTFY
jgi:hypothetical protein